MSGSELDKLRKDDRRIMGKVPPTKPKAEEKSAVVPVPTDLLQAHGWFSLADAKKAAEAGNLLHGDE